MASTLADLITEARSLIGQTVAANSQITNTQLTTWSNEAYRTFVARLGAIPETEYSLVAALGNISLSANMLTPLRAYIYNASTTKYEKLLIIGPDQLENIDPGWLSADTGSPSYFVRRSTFTAYLYPQPDSNYLAQDIKFYTIAFPTELSADSDTPDLPKNLIDLIPHYMAWRAFQQMQQTDKAIDKLIFINTQLKAQAQISTKFSGQQNRMMWTGRDDA